MKPVYEYSIDRFRRKTQHCVNRLLVVQRVPASKAIECTLLKCHRPRIHFGKVIWAQLELLHYLLVAVRRTIVFVVSCHEWGPRCATQDSACAPAIALRDL